MTSLGKYYSEDVLGEGLLLKVPCEHSPVATGVLTYPSSPVVFEISVVTIGPRQVNISDYLYRTIIQYSIFIYRRNSREDQHVATEHFFTITHYD